VNEGLFVIHGLVVSSIHRQSCYPLILT